MSCIDVAEAFTQVKSEAIGLDDIPLRFKKYCHQLYYHLLLIFLTVVSRRQRFRYSVSTTFKYAANTQRLMIKACSRLSSNFYSSSLVKSIREITQITKFSDTRSLYYVHVTSPIFVNVSEQLKVCNDIRTGMDNEDMSILVLTRFPESLRYGRSPNVNS